MTASLTHIKSSTWQQVDSNKSIYIKTTNEDEHSESSDGSRPSPNIWGWGKWDVASSLRANHVAVTTTWCHLGCVAIPTDSATGQCLDLSRACIPRGLSRWCGVSGKCVRRSQHLRNIASAPVYWWLSATDNLSISSYCLWCFLSNLIEVVRLAPGFAFQYPVAGMVSHASLLLAVWGRRCAVSVCVCLYCLFTSIYDLITGVNDFYK